MCTRFGISLEGRELHGALIDTTLLAKAYIEINNRFSEEDVEADLEQKNWVRAPVKRFSLSLPKVEVSAKDEEGHMAVLEDIRKSEKTEPVFLKSSPTLKM